MNRQRFHSRDLAWEYRRQLKERLGVEVSLWQSLYMARLAFGSALNLASRGTLTLPGIGTMGVQDHVTVHGRPRRRVRVTLSRSVQDWSDRVPEAPVDFGRILLKGPTHRSGTSASGNNVRSNLNTKPIPETDPETRQP